MEISPLTDEAWWKSITLTQVVGLQLRHSYALVNLFRYGGMQDADGVLLCCR